MSSRWWRAYDEAVDDPKIQRLAPPLFKSWFNLCCIASKNGGTLPAIADVAFKLHVSEHKAAEAITALVVAGLIDKREDGAFEPHNWEIRQFKSDVTDPTAAERMKRYRKNRNTVTPKTVTVTPPRDREQNTETDSGPKGPAAGAALSDVEILNEDPKAKLFRIGKTTLVSWGVAEKRSGSLLGMWLKARADPAGILSAIQFARDQNVPEPVGYITALLNSKSRANRNGKQDLTAMCFAIADEWRNQLAAGSPDGAFDLSGGH